MANINFKNQQCKKFNDVPYGTENTKYEWEFHEFESKIKRKIFSIFINIYHY